LLKNILTIGSEEAKHDALLLEVGQDYCCYAFLDRDSKTFGLIRYFSFDEFEAEEKLGTIINGINDQHFEKIIVCSAFVQALLVPQQYFKHDQSVTAAVYDSVSHQQLNDAVPEWQMVNSYSLPATLYEKITKRFSTAQFFHAYTPALKIYNGFVAADQVDIHFTTGYFRILVKKGQQVHLAQTYSYKTPLDVVYYLLKICYEFKLEQSEVFLIVSGLIDQDSAMYHELHNYFLNLHFAQAPAYSLPETGHPHYYFTSLYNLAACVL
jgi:hypothetical protein